MDDRIRTRGFANDPRMGGEVEKAQSQHKIKEGRSNIDMNRLVIFRSAGMRRYSI